VTQPATLLGAAPDAEARHHGAQAAALTRSGRHVRGDGRRRRRAWPVLALAAGARTDDQHAWRQAPERGDAVQPSRFAREFMWASAGARGSWYCPSCWAVATGVCGT